MKNKLIYKENDVVFIKKDFINELLDKIRTLYSASCALFYQSVDLYNPEDAYYSMEYEDTINSPLTNYEESLQGTALYVLINESCDMKELVFKDARLVSPNMIANHDIKLIPDNNCGHELIFQRKQYDIIYFLELLKFDADNTSKKVISTYDKALNKFKDIYNLLTTNIEVKKYTIEKIL